MQSLPFTVSILYNESNSVCCAYSVLVIGREALARASVYLFGFLVYMLIYSTVCDYLKRTHAFIAYYSDIASLYAALPLLLDYTYTREKWKVIDEK